MIATRHRNPATIGVYLLLSILLNYLLLSFLYTPHTTVIPFLPQEPTSTVNPLVITGIEIMNVPVISQMPLLPTGCESAAAAMLLQWAGVNVAMTEIADRLPKGPVPTEQNGKIIGGNPSYEFVGDPYSQKGFGVYHQPISDIIDGYLPLRSQDVTGCAFETLLEILDDGRPIVVWATIDMKEPSINAVWQDEHGGEVIWKTPEHAMILIGYTETHVLVNDPIMGTKVSYDRTIFKSRWEAMGHQAITLSAIVPQ